MKLLSSLRVGLLAFCLFFGVSGQAAVTQIVSGGILVGATGLEIDTDFNPATAPEIFNVSFVDGTFDDVFPNGIPAFHNTESLADWFSAQLAFQVFVDSPAGNFGSVPSLTRGCESAPFGCTVWVPYSVTFLDVISRGIINSDLFDNPAGTSFPRQTDLSSVPDGDNQVFAKFTQVSVSAVPEPSTYAMMVAGVMMIAGIKRRRNSA